MPKSKITRRLIDATPPQSKRVILHDTEVSGFQCRITPGGKKAFYFYFRTKAGRERRYKIGDYPAMTPEKARDIAKDLHTEVRSGGDPSLDRQRDRGTPTVAEFTQRFMAEHVEAKLKPRTLDEYQKLARNHIVPTLGKLPITDVSRADVTSLHNKLRSIPYMANRVVAILSKMFNKAEQWGVRADGTNPCRHVERYKEPQRERYLDDIELAALGEALSAMEREQKAPASAVAAIRLLIFTGARKEEIVRLRWENVDFETGLLRLPDSKSGKKTIVLGPPALQVLQNLSRIEGNPFVIAGKVSGQNLKGLQKVWERVRQRATTITWRAVDPAKGIIDQLMVKLHREPTYREITSAAEKAGVTLPVGLFNVRLHDLRHSFASVGTGAGLSLSIIGKMLGHSQAATTQRYAHVADNPLRSGVDAISSRIADTMNGRASEVADDDGEASASQTQRQRLKIV